jgi:hypothetical protein
LSPRGMRSDVLASLMMSDAHQTRNYVRLLLEI